MEEKKTIDVEVSEFIKGQIQTMKEEDPSLCQYGDPTLFTVLCLKNFFFNDSQWTYDDILQAVVDGGSDGSLDAILVDDSDETKPLIVVQSKYRNSYDHTTAKGEIAEMHESITNLSRKRYENFNAKVRDRYISCVEELIPGQSKTNYVYFSSFVPKKRSKTKFIDDINSDDTEIFFGDDIKSFIETNLEKTGRVKQGELEIDETNNILNYADSCIVNISANSLKTLYGNYRRSLLGLNLRYYVKNATVDNGLKDTIKNHPNQFWYLNNGIVITCENFEIDGTTLKLKNFSIVNGGQTTDKLFKTDFENDFFLLCKVVKVIGTDDDENSLSSRKIAIASNSQKPIQKKDLVSNKSEQVQLKAALKACGIQYLIKGGETIEKKYADKDKHISLDQLGKLGLAAVMQRPWTRSNASDLYDETKGYYYRIYDGTTPQIYSDLLHLDNIYKSFISSNYETNNKNLSNNARTYVLAILLYIATYMQFPNDPIFHEVPKTEDDLDKIANKIRKLNKIIQNTPSEEKAELYKLFGNICDRIIYPCFRVAERTNQDINESNFLKLKESYFDCFPDLLTSLKNKTPDIYILAASFFK